MGPQEPNDVSRDIARDLTGMAGEIAALKGDAGHWLTGPEYTVPSGTAWRMHTER